MPLRRASIDGPTISRRRRGRGFSYVGPSGPVIDAATLERIRALVIPPAWKDVRISPDPLGHIQAVGMDGAGRRQYLYHADWRVRRDEEKFERMVEFAHALPVLRERVSRDLSLRGVPKARALACSVRLLDHAFFRVGSEAYARERLVRSGHSPQGARHRPSRSRRVRLRGQEWQAARAGDRRR